MQQQPKLMLVKSYDDGSSNWRVACDCIEAGHDVNLWFDADEDYQLSGDINLNLSMEIGARECIGSRYDNTTIIENISWVYRIIKWRVTTALKILFSGYYIMSGNVILDINGINAMQTALAEGVKLIKK